MIARDITDGRDADGKFGKSQRVARARAALIDEIARHDDEIGLRRPDERGELFLPLSEARVVQVGDLDDAVPLEHGRHLFTCDRDMGTL